MKYDYSTYRIFLAMLALYGSVSECPNSWKFIQFWRSQNLGDSGGISIPVEFDDYEAGHPSTIILIDFLSGATAGALNSGSGKLRDRFSKRSVVAAIWFRAGYLALTVPR